KETPLYERHHLPSGDEYSFGQQLEGGNDLHDLWKKATGPQVLFLAQAVANSSEDLKQLRDPLTWLQTGFMIVSGGMEGRANSSQKLVKEHPILAEEISSFLQDVDVPVTNIRVDQIEPNSAEPVSSNKLMGLISSKPKSKTILTHRTALGEAEFDFQEESEGTKNLIGFWLPWSIHADSNFAKEKPTLVVDELDSSLHPEIVVSLVAKHLKSDSPAQLIFTTHDTHLMDAKLMRRDQFWLTERDSNGATQLRSIHDFEGRGSEDMEKRYFEGRYRGLPFVRRG
ncbi:MAG: AAA family ATPase, partial [Methylococcaceae bacterium]